MSRSFVGAALIALAAATLSGQARLAQEPPRNPRLFEPQNLGLLEPPDREAWQKPDQVMDALHVAEGGIVADLGAGGGWFTIRLARRVGQGGMVYAVDVQRLMIEAITRRMQREGLENVRPILGTDDDPRLPTGAVDAVLIVDAFHEIENKVGLLQNIARALKSQGRIGIIDYREGEGGPGPAPDERVGPEVVIATAAKAGLKLVEQQTFLPYQYFLIFSK
jgi:ubiquinone/menaquinone biosynthesis C-methylase UbiE